MSTRAADRAHLYNRQPNPNSSVNAEQTHRLMEDQNDEKIDQLSIQIGALKKMTQDINNAVKEDNKFLDGMGQDFDNTDSLMGGTLKKLGNMMDTGGGKHMWMLIGFVVVVFVLLYFLMTGKY
ncbi:hypothetical protein H257_12511 [Aphanomyces astaci]|uniref:t-SNARE coiled-coil homology domain-containing protein n=2 Tax=Aphanomyces astaci TaxID=112090 RepID=W4FZD5_APHAT|nr:hypothetical protein H257_12511 [Aphanomyces astaci]ETV72361.1 hypothetical protein H257_12511 [Aphanomyces astaci]|eukprot:XP_009838043.1 hypothetical protein H257_12511 [Aphanomyces astaci]